jgi:hypothetical protein
MHVSEMLRGFAPDVVPAQPLEIRNDVDISVIQEMIANISNELSLHKSETEFVTSLNGKQAELVMEQVFDLKEKYFHDDVPLVNVFKKQFVWNIPSYIYKYMQDVVDKEEPDVLNPMLLFYVFLTDHPDEGMYCKYLQILSSVLNQNKTYIDHHAAEYDAWNDEEE